MYALLDAIISDLTPIIIRGDETVRYQMMV